MNEACHTSMSRLTHMNEACHTYGWGDVSRMWKTSSTMARRICTFVVLLIWISHVTRMDESYGTLEWVVMSDTHVCHTCKDLVQNIEEGLKFFGMQPDFEAKEAHCQFLTICVFVWHHAFMCVTSLIRMCDVDHSDVRHDSFRCVTWVIQMCDMTHPDAWRDSFRCVTWPIQMWDMTHSQMCDVTHSYVWCDAFTCVQWLNQTQSSHNRQLREREKEKARGRERERQREYMCACMRVLFTCKRKRERRRRDTKEERHKGQKGWDWREMG